MHKRKVALRLFVLIFVMFGFWFTIIRWAPQKTTGEIQQAISVLDSLNTQNLSTPLEQIDGKTILLRDHATVIASYKQTEYAVSEVSRQHLLLQNTFRTPWFFKLFGSRYSSASNDLRTVNSLLSSMESDYHELSQIFTQSNKVSLALTNLYYYDPRVDQQSLAGNPNYEDAANRYAGAAQGLQKVADRLGQVPIVSSSEVKRWIPQISSLSQQASKISEAASSSSSSASQLAAVFTGKIMDIQQQILTQQQSFWDTYPRRQNLLTKLQEYQNQISEARAYLNADQSRF